MIANLISVDTLMAIWTRAVHLSLRWPTALFASVICNFEKAILSVCQPDIRMQLQDRCHRIRTNRKWENRRTDLHRKKRRYLLVCTPFVAQASAPASIRMATTITAKFTRLLYGRG